MNKKYGQRILNMVKINCPLCDEKFKYRANLRHHLKKKHNDADAEDLFYMMKKNL